MPVSIAIVLDVFSGKHSKVGTEYPEANPRVCVKKTASRTNPATPPLPLAIIAELFATTPPQIKLTSNTLANGVNRDIHRHNFGNCSFMITPIITGANTTFAVARHSDLPLTEMVLPTISLVRRGVTAEANIVEHVVRRTLSALSGTNTRF
jgi:hypothetical protein